MKSGNLNFQEPSGPLQACNGTDLLFHLFLVEGINGRVLESSPRHSCKFIHIVSHIYLSIPAYPSYHQIFLQGHILNQIFLHVHIPWVPYLCRSAYPQLHIPACPCTLRYPHMPIYPQLHIPACPYTLRYTCMPIYPQLHIPACRIPSYIPVGPYILSYLSLHVHIPSDIPVCPYIFRYSCMPIYPQLDIRESPYIGTKTLELSVANEHEPGLNSR
jgi:hypothetical protein